MKSVKITLAALAFVFAIGTAMATKSHTGDVPCTNVSGRFLSDCEGPTPPDCCIDADNNHYPGEVNE